MGVEVFLEPVEDPAQSDGIRLGLEAEPLRGVRKKPADGVIELSVNPR